MLWNINTHHNKIRWDWYSKKYSRGRKISLGVRGRKGKIIIKKKKREEKGKFMGVALGMKSGGGLERGFGREMWEKIYWVSAIDLPYVFLI